MVGCGHELTASQLLEQPVEQYDAMVFDVEIIEISEESILARGLSDFFRNNLTFSHSHLPDIGVWESAIVTITADPWFMDTYPAQVVVIDWQHANVVINAQIRIITNDIVVVRGIEEP